MYKQAPSFSPEHLLKQGLKYLNDSGELKRLTVDIYELMEYSNNFFAQKRHVFEFKDYVL